MSTILFLLLERRVFKHNYRSFNPIDRAARRLFCEPLQNFIGTQRSEMVADALYQLVLALNDTQLVTGNAVLIAALKKLHVDGAITLYHFSIASDLAWFSSNTQLLTSVVIQSRDSVKLLTRPGTLSPPWWPKPSLLLRIVLMTLMAAMLLYVCWITGYYGWSDDFSCPVSCITGSSKGGEQLDWTIVNFVLILYAYPTAIFHHFKRARLEWLIKFRHKFMDNKALRIQEIQTKVTSEHMGLRLAGIRCARAFRSYVLRPILYFLTSEFESLLEQVAWFTIGVISVLQNRAFGHSIMDDTEAVLEDSWGFGQLVPVLLLILPLFQFLQSWNGKGVY
jgi:hypothetical protein